MNKFAIKILKRIKENDISGYNMKFIPCFVEVEAQTLYQAGLLVESIYSDANEYIIDFENSYMILPPIKY